ncbi:MAG: hypothetical protein AB1631_18875 [Acidobacteriota bacterium]
MNTKEKISCRKARRSFGSSDERVERHREACERCAKEYRLQTLTRAALDLAASPEEVRPDEDFFVALRERIARGPERIIQPVGDESWSAALWLTARQLIPAMAILLMLIIGATLFFNSSAPDDQTALRPRDIVVFNDIYDYPEPTPDDVLQTLVAVEERENGR